MLARLLLQDDAAQFKRAKALLGSGQMFTAPVTVMLDLPNFRLVQADTVRAALGAYAQGLDFADALHLGLSSGADALLTFDKVFAKRARCGLPGASASGLAAKEQARLHTSSKNSSTPSRCTAKSLMAWSLPGKMICCARG